MLLRVSRLCPAMEAFLAVTGVAFTLTELQTATVSLRPLEKDHKEARTKRAVALRGLSSSDTSIPGVSGDELNA